MSCILMHMQQKTLQKTHLGTRRNDSSSESSPFVTLFSTLSNTNIHVHSCVELFHNIAYVFSQMSAADVSYVSYVGKG